MMPVLRSAEESTMTTNLDKTKILTSLLQSTKLHVECVQRQRATYNFAPDFWYYPSGILGFRCFQAKKFEKPPVPMGS